VEDRNALEAEQRAVLDRVERVLQPLLDQNGPNWLVAEATITDDDDALPT